jgi:hypothetical protein
MSQSIVVAKDLIEQFPDDYSTVSKECPKCGGKMYDYAFVYGWQCENVVYRCGRIWEDSPCDNSFLGGG